MASWDEQSSCMKQTSYAYSYLCVMYETLKCDVQYALSVLITKTCFALDVRGSMMLYCSLTIRIKYFVKSLNILSVKCKTSCGVDYLKHAYVLAQKKAWVPCVSYLCTQGMLSFISFISVIFAKPSRYKCLISLYYKFNICNSYLNQIMLIMHMYMKQQLKTILVN